MNLKELKKIIEVMKNEELLELEIEEEGLKIRIKRRGAEVIPQISTTTPPGEEGKTKELLTITAPMVGTFYRAPSPEAESYVEIGDVVKKGQTACIIEAMKLMNEIESEVEGKIVKIMVENGHPVEYGQPLFLLEPI
jgi:acetyl-CoA carboxylase biotin carboxyl carrier protein